MTYAIGIDVGGTKTNIGIISATGEVITSRTIATNALEPAELQADLITEIGHLLTGEYEIDGIGLASAGRVDFARKKVVYATDNLQGWTEIPIVENLEAEFDLPVYIDNDVNAALLCDLRLHPEYAAAPTTVFLTIGTGLGGAIAQHGQILRGETGSTGEFGHMILYPYGEPCNCGKSGCAEQYISGTAYKRILVDELQRARVSYTDADLQPEEIQRQIFANHQPYVNALNRMARDLALLLESIKNCLDFDTCIIGGSFTVYEKWLLEEINQQFAQWNHKYQQEPRFVVTKEGNQAGMIGAGLLVFTNE